MDAMARAQHRERNQGLALLLEGKDPGPVYPYPLQGVSSVRIVREGMAYVYTQDEDGHWHCQIANSEVW